MGYSFCGPYNRHLLHTARSPGSDGQWNWDYQFDANAQLQGYTLTFLDDEYGPTRQEIKFYY
ncbi:MAG: hypothetical protein IJ721_10500 [Bacteroidales bacterium]|nr:hypothetical protein [Bacteroidales bacterium]